MPDGLDPEALLGIKSNVLKAAAAGTLLGILWRRQFRLWEALSAAAAGMCSAIYVAPAVVAWAGIVHDDIKNLVVFGSGLLGMYIIDASVTYGPRLIRNRLERTAGGEDVPTQKGPSTSLRSPSTELRAGARDDSFGSGGKP